MVPSYHTIFRWRCFCFESFFPSIVLNLTEMWIKCTRLSFCKPLRIFSWFFHFHFDLWAYSTVQINKPNSWELFKAALFNQLQTLRTSTLPSTLNKKKSIEINRNWWIFIHRLEPYKILISIFNAKFQIITWSIRIRFDLNLFSVQCIFLFRQVSNRRRIKFQRRIKYRDEYTGWVTYIFWIFIQIYWLV